MKDSLVPLVIENDKTSNKSACIINGNQVTISMGKQH